MSMRWRLLISFGLIILVALVTVSLVTRYTTEQEVQTFLGHGGQVGLENLSDALERYYASNNSWDGVDVSGGAGVGRGRGSRAGSNASLGEHILSDPKGIVLYSPASEEIGSELAQSTIANAIDLEVDGETVGYLLPEGGVPELPENFDALLIERVNRATLLAALISGGLAVLLALIMAALILKPIRGLISAVGKMADGDLSQRVDLHGSDELTTLGEAFNQMSHSLQEAEQNRQAMTADIAHELRNPLAIQRAHLEALQDGLYPLNQENLAVILEQNQQLTHLVEDLRTLALADAGELALNKRPVDLVSVCNETLARFEPQAKVKEITLVGDFAMEKLNSTADKERLQQIFDNLMQNAFRYTPNGGEIKLSLHLHGTTAVLEVFNNGPQISEDALAHLFERFYRGDKARDRASGGTGLGLAIARKLAEAHDGTLTAENSLFGGVVFRLTLPV